MTNTTKSTIAAVIVFAAGTAHADIAHSGSISNFSIFANNKVNFNHNVTSSGNIGAGSQVSMNQSTSVSGDVYSGQDFWSGSHSTFSGDIVANNNVSTDSYVNVSGTINAGNSTSINSNGNYQNIQSGGAVSVGQSNSINGSIDAGTSVWLNSYTNVRGSVRYGTTYAAAPTATIDQYLGTNPTAPAQWSTPKFESTRNFTHTGGNSIWVGGQQSSTVEQGSYGSISTGNYSDLTFESGYYSFESFYAGNYTDVTFDNSEGDIVIYSNSNFNSGDYVEFTTTSQENQIYIYAANGIWIGNGSSITASMQAIDGSISIGSNASINGTMFAGWDISVGANSTFIGAAIPGPTPSAVIAMAFMISGRRRR